jgi:hypothetical protein
MRPIKKMGTATTTLLHKLSHSENWPRQQRISDKNVWWVRVDLEEFTRGDWRRLAR